MRKWFKHHHPAGITGLESRGSSSPGQSDRIPSSDTHADSSRLITKRYHHLDALRGLAMLLGIVLHGLLSFVFLPIWPAQDIHQNTGLYGLFQHAIHGFRMPLFFLISGFFTAMMWRKRGHWGLLRHRAQRILLPLIIGTILMGPLMIGISHWGTKVKHQRGDVESPGMEMVTAAKQGDTEGLQQLLARGGEVNQRDALGVSPMEWAAMYNHPEVIMLLADHGADVNGRNPEGSTPLHAACFLGRREATRKLIELGADPTAKNHRGDTPLVAAQMDMGLVHFIAGMLQMEIDSEAVATARQETAAYLDPIVHPRPAEGGSEERHLSGTAPRAPDSRGLSDNNSHSTLLNGVILGLTFFPFFHHLWFLYYLLWMVGLFLIAAWIWGKIPLQFPRRLIATPGCFFWLVPLTWWPQIYMTQTFGADTAAGLLPWPPKLAYYALFFGFGALAFGEREFEDRAGRRWGLLLILAIPTLLTGLHILQEAGDIPYAHHWIALSAALYAWLMVFALIGLFRHFFSDETPWVRYLSDSSYWLYLAHLPLLIGLQIAVSSWDLHHFPKFLIVCALTFTILMGIYRYLIRYSFIGTLLNGKKIRPAPAESPDRPNAIRVGAEP